MTKTAPIKVLAFTAASTVLAFTVACVDQTSPVRAVGLAARDAAGGDRMINTPFGPRPESTVHLLARGHAARINGQHVEEIDSKGTVVSEYGIGPASFGDSGGSPWITSDSLVLPSTDTLVHFETDVVVPAPPSNEYGSQYITVWEGLQKPGGPIVQPVLTWGYQGVTGEGNYWTVACWEDVSSSGPIYYSPPIDVSTGDTVYMYLGSKSNGIGNGTFTYNCFAGKEPVGADTTDSMFLDVPRIPDVVEALEGYGTIDGYPDENCWDFPNQDSVPMMDISLWINGSYPTTANWSTPMYYDNACGQQTVVVDSANSAQPTSSGQLDIYFRNDTNPPTAVSLGQMYDGEVPCIWIGGPTGGTTPLVYTWSSSDFGVFEVDTTSNTQDTVGWYDPYTPPAADLTVSLTVTDVLGASASNSDYVTGYDCPDERPRGGSKVKTGNAGVKGSVGGRRLP
jgi:hypothetical protein